MFNFRNGTALAVQQDQYLKAILAGISIAEKDIKDMENNLWVQTAFRMAPSNLVIRQYALIDLARNKPNYKLRIFKLFDILSYAGVYSGDYRIWAEGYSYFGYTMDILKLWVARFELTDELCDLKHSIEKVEKGFAMTSYTRNNTWYPAPLGDVRDTPLAPEHQPKTTPTSAVMANITYTVLNDAVCYEFKARPIGCNTHIPLNDSKVMVIDGIPAGFKFYEGYDKKYKNKWDEYLDTFNLKRLKSIP